MKSENISDAMNYIDDELIEETQTVRQKKKQQKAGWKKWIALAACVALVLTIGIQMVMPQEEIVLSNNSNGVTVRYSNIPFYFGTGESSQIYLTEKELFTEYDTAIFKGTISAIDNIVMDFNGVKEYRAIAQIKVEQVYRGDCEETETVSVLLPCPITFSFHTEDAEVVTNMEVGMRGIFMPMIYDDTSKREENGATLMLKDIADYGFVDGNRYLFLETENGFIFDRTAYESIANAMTLDEIQDYIIQMLNEQVEQ